MECGWLNELGSWIT